MKKLPLDTARERIAIIGMACRMPGARSYAEFWDNLRNEVNSVGEIPPQRWSKDEHYSVDPEAPNKSVSKWGGFIAGADEFDAMYFGISPREAQYMDPQQRIILELAASCFEDAGYPESKVSGSRTAVYIGASLTDHLAYLGGSQQAVFGYWATGMAMSLISNRISYQFNLNGPSMCVDTACSSSLLALHHGIQSLRLGECDMALIGGSSVLATPIHFTSFSKLGMLSPDGMCRTFDEGANGYVRGEGAGLVLLKFESQAIADGDRILGIISGTAANHGGRARTLTSPNAFSQARVIVEAHEKAGIAPDSVSYIEAHGTGTPLGDPIEMIGLKRAFAKLAERSGVTLKENSCAVGSVKTNIGHLEPVAGIASLVKVLLCLSHKTLPKLLHFEKLNPRIELQGSPFYMLNRTEPWRPTQSATGEDLPRRAGISCFGFGGTNVHAVVDEAPLPASRSACAKPGHLICLSAKTEEALRLREQQLLEWLDADGSDAELRDISYTLLLGRQHWQYRSAFMARSLAEVKSTLASAGASAESASLNRGAVAPAKQEALGADAGSPAATLVEQLRQQVLGDDAYCAGLSALAESFCAGVGVDWSLLFAKSDARRIALPTYPFARKRYSIYVAPNELSPAVTPQPAPVVASAAAPHAPVATVANERAESVRRPRISLPALSEPARSTASVRMPDNAAASPAPRLPTEAPVSSAEVAAASGPRKPVSAKQWQEELRDSLAAALYADVDGVDVARPFVDQGLDSVVGVEWMRNLNRTYGLNIAVTKLYDHPSIEALGRFLESEVAKRAARAMPPVAAGVESAFPALATGVAAPAHRQRLMLSPIAVATSAVPPESATAAPSPRPPREAEQPPADAAVTLSRVTLDDLKQQLRLSLAAALYMEAELIQFDRPFVDLGLDSVVGVEWIRAINKSQGLKLAATKLYDYPTIQTLAAYIAPLLPAGANAEPPAAGARARMPMNDAAPASRPMAAAPCRPDAVRSLPVPVRDGPYGLVLSTVHGLDELALGDWAVAAPAAGEVTIRVHASAINYPDVMCVQGLYPTQPDYPFVPGFELAGVVSALGAGVSSFAVGDEVIAVTGHSLGAHASHASVAVGQVIRKPLGMSFEVACSIPVVFSTVQQAFETARLSAGEHVLIQTATGGCGLAAVQMASLLGSVCWGTSSQDHKLDVLRRIGVDHVINYRTTAFDTEILRLTDQRGVDVVLNMLAGDAIQRGLNCLAPFGRYLEIAVHALRTSQKLDLSRLVQNQSVHSIDLRRRMLSGGISWSAAFAPLVPLFESKQLRPVVSRIYPVGQIVEAMQYVLQGKHIGKVVISHTRAEMVDCTEACIEGVREQRQACLDSHANRQRLSFSAAPAPLPMPAVHAQEDIAVIGMSGQFPQAPDLDSFWDNLRQGKDSVTEIPGGRWPVAAYFDGNGRVAEKTYCKWMGALDGVDQFDPLFFNIAPAEAGFMDPEQRLLLQNVWHCLEDAGVRPRDLAGSRCGVFMGNASGDYGLMLGADRLTAHGLMGGAASIASGRVSYFLNLQGPCMSIDTACSSSLTALAEACNSLVLRTSDLALAGGAYVMSGPSMHIMASQAGMLSPRGRCQTFDQNADGFVPGEGVGIVLLKRLSDAVRDGDRICGVIKGWGIKQDGKTNGITAPSVNSQIALEREIYERFNINPEHISLVEAHGTGTKLGDPIEVEALTQSFRAHTSKKQYCALGSVKANIGHALTAAGIGGFIKVMLCMENRTLVPSVHYTTPNEHIDFAESPFFVNTKQRDWNPAGSPTRMAAISSFGFSGTNVHLVMEEAPVQAPRADHRQVRQLILLSGKTDAALKANAGKLLDHARAHPELRLDDLAYTLQIGRESMQFRLAFTAASHTELLERLERHARGTASQPEGVSSAGTTAKFVSYFETDTDAQALLRSWMNKQDLEKLAELWLQGLDIDWRLLHAGTHLRRVRLPGYAFARESYWLPSALRVAAPAQPTDVRAALSYSASAAALHPLVHQNVSSFSEQRFRSHFSGAEFFLTDHKVRQGAVLPGAAQLEMARAAMVQSTTQSDSAARMLTLRDVSWIRPLSVGPEGADVGISLKLNADGSTDWQVDAMAERAHPKLYSKGTACWEVMDRSAPVAKLDLTALRAECTLPGLDAAACYAAFSAVQLDYGPGHRALVHVHRGRDLALARLQLPAALEAGFGDYTLHPSLLDSALQACVGLLVDGSGLLPRLALPAGLQELQILDAFQASMWACVRPSASANAGGAGDVVLDIDLCDDGGRVCLRLRGLVLRAPGGQDPGMTPNKHPAGVGLARRTWTARERSAAPTAHGLATVDRLAVFCELDHLEVERLKSGLPGVRCLFLNRGPDDLGTRFGKHVENLLRELRQSFQTTSSAPLRVQLVHGHTGESALAGALGGMLKAAQLENPLMTGQVISVDARADADQIVTLVQEESRQRDEFVRVQGHQREVACWSSVALASSPEMTWKAHGVYLISGGAGGLGFAFAADIVRRTPTAHVVLTGRSALTAAQRARVQALVAEGGSVEYLQLDVADGPAVFKLLAEIEGKRGRLDGILHSAGVLRDGFIRQKQLADVPAVLAPKVAGLINLDEASQAMALDFFVSFSSMAAVMGNFGQADYAAANAFMDVYAAYRQDLVAAGQRKGRSLSINWPLWDAGGMQVDKASAERIRRTIGIVGPEQGLEAFHRAMVLPDAQLAVTVATADELNATRSVGEPVIVATSAETRGKVRDFVIDTLVKVLKIPASRLDAKTPFEKYGIDSIVQATLIQEMESSFGELPKTLLFEHSTIDELVDHLVAHHAGAWPKPAAATAQPIPDPARTVAKRDAPIRTLVNPLPAAASANSGARAADIAIVGMAGRYPQSSTLDRLWQNLLGGRNCITSAPVGRWAGALADREASAEVLLARAGLFGGFLDGVDRFDHRLFGVAKEEVLAMAPELRLLLEVVWETLEDSGYNKSRLQALQNRMGLGVGVFIGSMYSQYEWGMANVTEAATHSNQTEWQLANRLSHFFDLRGPSIALNTACSSSLTAIHLACDSLRLGGCSMAIAGGVNLTLDPSKYAALRQAKMLDGGPRSMSLGIGEGYVPGEGVGAVLLKPLAMALRDNDRIDGVIKSSFVNHSGGRQKYTVPDPKRQAELISNSIRQSGLDVETITYVETAANGSPLGDPIEILALRNAFEQLSTKRQFCSLGSVKSNLGHLEAASGISQLSKVLLQLKHQTLVPSIHAEPLNPAINLASGAFQLQRAASPWPQPTDRATGELLPRRSMINSFGAGGAYANLIVEEFVAAQKQHPHAETASWPCVFSAQTPRSLMRYFNRLRKHLEQRPELHVADVASSLGKINNDLECRAAIIASSVADLLAKLAAVAEAPDRAGPGVFLPAALATGGHTENADAADPDLAAQLTSWIQGQASTWQGLSDGERPCLSLPKYAFEHDRAFHFQHVPAARPGQRSAEVEALFQSIFERIAQGTLSEEEAWALVQSSEA